jgi:predicted DNA-binding protein (UPF0251 family)
MDKKLREDGWGADRMELSVEMIETMWRKQEEIDAAIHAKPDERMMRRLMRNLRGRRVTMGSLVPGLGHEKSAWTLPPIPKTPLDKRLKQAAEEAARSKQAPPVTQRTARRLRERIWAERERPASVSERDWEMLRLVDVEDLREYEVAKRMGLDISYAAVRKALERARKARDASK